jgi:hypothetical protein
MILTDRELLLLNEIVPRAKPEGAYALGVLSCMAWKHGLELDREIIEACAKVPSAEQALEVWEFHRHRLAAHRLAKPRKKGKR